VLDEITKQIDLYLLEILLFVHLLPLHKMEYTHSFLFLEITKKR
jgi:hypothetical protein